MSKIKVNETEVVEGSFSFQASIDRTGKTPVLVIEGIFETADEFSSLNMLENERYKLTGITLLNEAYGSEEDKVAYTFLANNYELKGR